MNSADLADFDYSTTGKDIQSAMVAAATARGGAKQRRGAAPRPPVIKWGHLRISTADSIEVPKEGRLRIQFLSNKQQVRQGVDIKMDGGCLLADGTRVPILRTWDDEGYEPVVEYDYLARDGLIRTWNVYERQWPRGETTEEKWTGNAGMRVEMVSPQERIYHCSAGHLSRPDFESLVYRLTILT